MADTCEAPGCSNPIEQTSRRGLPKRFCSDDCRMRAFVHRRQTLPHKCPQCHVHHDPEERAILDALEHFIGSNPRAADGALLTIHPEALRGFIQHRRDLLKT